MKSLHFVLFFLLLFCILLLLDKTTCEKCSGARLNRFANKDWVQLLRTEGKALPTKPKRPVDINDAPLNLKDTGGFVLQRICKLPQQAYFPFQ